MRIPRRSPLPAFSHRAPVLALLAWAWLLGVLPDPAGAQARPSGENAPLNLPAPARQADQASSGGGGSIVRTIVGLAIVVGVIYGLSWVLRQVKASREGQASGAGLSAVASVPLGPSSSLHLVRAGHDLVLLGVGEKGVVPIRTYAEDEARAAGLLDDETPDDDADELDAGPALAGIVLPAAPTPTAAPKAKAPARAPRPAPPALGANLNQAVAALRRRTVRR